MNKQDKVTCPPPPPRSQRTLRGMSRDATGTRVQDELGPWAKGTPVGSPVRQG